MPAFFESNFSIRALINTDSSDDEMMDEVNNQQQIINESDALPPSPPSELDYTGYTYGTLILMAIRSSPDHQMLLCNIYKWIDENFPTFVNERKNWKNQVRHTLSTNSCFVKMQRASDDPGRGHYWTINTAHPGSDFGAGGGTWQQSYAPNGYAPNPYIHGVPCQHPLAASAVYFPTPEEIQMNIQKEQELFIHFYRQQQFYQQQMLPMQQL